MFAAFIDGILILAIDSGVLYFTLQLCGLTFAEVLMIPPLPLLGFLALLNGGYFVALTVAGGQTIGKMATGIKVVSDPHGRVPFGRATLRTAGYLASLLPAGLGFLPGLFGHDRRALHDRLASTRVVRVYSR
jgi:uncharacterized RDD family membrane protein YckC